MSRPSTVRTTMSALLAVALLAGGFVLCPCVGTPEDAHSCCESTAWRAAGAGCCGAADESPDTAVAGPSSDQTAAVASSSWCAPVRADIRGGADPLPAVSFVSPPPAVLRI